MTDNRSVAELFSDALNQFSKLVRNEIHLARAEISLKASQAMIGVAFLMGGALLCLPALVLLLMALAAWFEDLGLATPLANLLAGIMGLLVSALIGWAGLSRLKSENLAPRRTMEQLHRDAAAVKEQV